MGESKAVHYSVKITDSSAKWMSAQKLRLSTAVQMMANSTLKGALILAPKAETNNLRTSGHVEVEDNGLSAAVIFGSGRVKYAGYQERGERFDGSHKVKHYTTPGTGKRYLKQSGDAAVEKGLKWYLSHS